MEAEFSLILGMFGGGQGLYGKRCHSSRNLAASTLWLWHAVFISEVTL